MICRHKQLAIGKWFKLSLIEQMANIGSEIERTIIWKKKDKNISQRAFERALELLNLTITDIKNKSRLKEIARLREILIDYFQFENQFSSSDQLWRNYFNAFNFAACRNR